MDADRREPRNWPQALQLPVGTHHLCGCRAGSTWPLCAGDREDCGRCRHTVTLAAPRFFWICQCGDSRELPFCDGDGHIAAARREVHGG